MMIDQIIKPQPILIPNNNIDYSRWAVVACDQFSSQPEYWEELKKYVELSPSTLNLILPEAFLKKDNSDKIKNINFEMTKYIESGIFEEVKSGMILVERTTPYSAKRFGLVTSIDLEKYSFNIADCSLVRASEGTILERIPPRVKIRENAKIELPHTMLLMSDPDMSVMQTAYNDLDKKLIYDFELNMGGGHIKGYEIKNTQKVLKAIEAISHPSYVKKVCKSDEGFVLAVGDGNHSLAAAKVSWNKIKRNLTPEQISDHPARFTLVEIVNLYDEGLNFYPIHRVVKNIDTKKFITKFKLHMAKEKGETKIIVRNELITVPIPVDPIDAIEAIQNFLDEFKLDYESIVIDYIHGDKQLKDVVSDASDNLGILMPLINKKDFFSDLAKRKVLPKKAFSMGEAVEKRYYLEARFIQ